jgi:putative heme-binding domain-containing protein
MPNGEAVQVPRSDILTLRSSDRSMMPEGLESGMSHQEMADLIEYVMQAKPAQ